MIHVYPLRRYNSLSEASVCLQTFRWKHFCWYFLVPLSLVEFIFNRWPSRIHFLSLLPPVHTFEYIAYDFGIGTGLQFECESIHRAHPLDFEIWIVLLVYLCKIEKFILFMFSFYSGNITCFSVQLSATECTILGDQKVNIMVHKNLSYFNQ